MGCWRTDGVSSDKSLGKSCFDGLIIIFAVESTAFSVTVVYWFQCARNIHRHLAEFLTTICRDHHLAVIIIISVIITNSVPIMYNVLLLHFRGFLCYEYDCYEVRSNARPRTGFRVETFATTDLRSHFENFV